MVKKCNNNQILVKKKSNNKNTSYCKKDIGKKRKGPKTLPPISDDISLSRYGYSLSKSDKKRKTSLNKASKKHGTLTVLRRINLIRNDYKLNINLSYLLFLLRLLCFPFSRNLFSSSLRIRQRFVTSLLS